MRMRTHVVAAVCCTSLIVGAAAPARVEDRNPPRGPEIALRVPGMERASVRRDVVYARRGDVRLRLDVYRPRGAARNARLPGVLLVHGSTTDPSPKGWAIYVGWGQLLAANGLAGIPFNHRGNAADVRAALGFVRAHAARLGIDPKRLCLASFSLGVPVGLDVGLRDRRLRCLLVFYGPPDAALLRADSPTTLIAKAGLDDATINGAIDAYVARARAIGADVRMLVHPRGVHGFDALNHDARSRAILRAAIKFARNQLQSR
jgi:dienelactone hydrolase